MEADYRRTLLRNNSRVFQIPNSAARSAAQLSAAGWRPIDPLGRLAPPLGDQPTAAQWVDDWTWQAMVLQDLQAQGPAGEVCAGTRRASIPPIFAPGSGWYVPGQHSPSSATERLAVLEAAIPVTVVVLRWRGERIPAAELLRTEPPSGLLVCMNRYTAPKWHACLFQSKAMDKEVLPRLMHAELERQSGGVRLYGGLQVDRNDQWRQAWLCTPTPERAREILLGMLEQEGGVP